MNGSSKAIFSALVIVAVAFTVSACGKKKSKPANNNVSVAPSPSSPYVPPPPAPVNPTCPIPSPSGSIASTFSGTGALTISNASSAVWGDFYSSGATVGGTCNTFIKNNQITGDQLILSVYGSTVSGPGYSFLQGAVVAYLTAATTNFFQTYCGSAPVRIRFNNTLLVAGTPGSIGISSPRLEAINGCGLLL